MHRIPRATPLSEFLRLSNSWLQLPKELRFLNHADYFAQAMPQPAWVSHQWGAYQSLERSLALWPLAGHLAQFCSHLLSCSLAADQTTLS